MASEPVLEDIQNQIVSSISYCNIYHAVRKKQAIRIKESRCIFGGIIE